MHEHKRLATECDHYSRSLIQCAWRHMAVEQVQQTQWTLIVGLEQTIAMEFLR